MARKPGKTKKEVTVPTEIDFHWIKNASYRTVHVDGAFGGLSPKGDYINMSLFTERWPIPRQTTHAVIGGQIDSKNIKERIGVEGIVREVEINLVFDSRTAQSMVDWLKLKIKDAQIRERERLRLALEGLADIESKKKSQVKSITKANTKPKGKTRSKLKAKVKLKRKVVNR